MAICSWLCALSLHWYPSLRQLQAWLLSSHSAVYIPLRLAHIPHLTSSLVCHHFGGSRIRFFWFIDLNFFSIFTYLTRCLIVVQLASFPFVLLYHSYQRQLWKESVATFIKKQKNRKFKTIKNQILVLSDVATLVHLYQIWQFQFIAIIFSCFGKNKFQSVDGMILILKWISLRNFPQLSTKNGIFCSKLLRNDILFCRVETFSFGSVTMKSQKNRFLVSIRHYFLVKVWKYVFSTKIEKLVDQLKILKTYFIILIDC